MSDKLGNAFDHTLNDLVILANISLSEGAKGQLVLSYRNCSESLPVLCEEQSTEITSLSSSIPVSSTSSQTTESTLTKTMTRSLIDNDGNYNLRMPIMLISVKKNREYTKIFRYMQLLRKKQDPRELRYPIP